MQIFDRKCAQVLSLKVPYRYGEGYQDMYTAENHMKGGNDVQRRREPVLQVRSGVLAAAAAAIAKARRLRADWIELRAWNPPSPLNAVHPPISLLCHASSLPPLSCIPPSPFSVLHIPPFPYLCCIPWSPFYVLHHTIPLLYPVSLHSPFSVLHPSVTLFVLYRPFPS